MDILVRNLIVLISAFVIPVIADLLDNEGKEFIIGYMKNERKEQDPYQDLLLIVTTSKLTTVNVTVNSPLYGNISEDFNISAGCVKRIPIDEDYRIQTAGMSSKGIVIQSDDEIIVYGVNFQVYSAGGFLALPTDILGTEYYAITYYPSESETQILLIGVHNSTQVSIILPSNVNSTNTSTAYDGTYREPGSTINITLERCSTYLLVSSGDLSGTHITSDKVISVFSGNVKAKVGGGNSTNHLVEHLTPVNTWGKRFLTIPTPNRTVGDFYKFINSEEDTFVSFLCNSSGVIISKSFHLLEVGNSSQTHVAFGYYCYVVADKPILLVQIILSQQSDYKEWDQSMMTIPPISQYSANYTFITPESSTGESYENYFMFAIKKDEISGLIIDGRTLPKESNYTDIPGTAYLGGLVYLFDNDGVHFVNHTSGTSEYSGFLLGSSRTESYGFSVGMKLKNINAISVPSSFVLRCLQDVDDIHSNSQNIAIDEMILDMKIDKSNTKSAVRKRSSVYEDRYSAILIGCIAVSIVLFFICGIIYLDIVFVKMFLLANKKVIGI